jgi:hypothetical protein
MTECPTEAHAHDMECAALIAAPTVIHFDRIPVAITWNRQITERLITLLNRHGLADVPDRRRDPSAAPVLRPDTIHQWPPPPMTTGWSGPPTTPEQAAAMGVPWPDQSRPVLANMTDLPPDPTHTR